MSDIIKSLKNIKEQLNQLDNNEEANPSANVQPEKLMTSPLISCQRNLFPQNNINNSDQQKLIMELRRKNMELEKKNKIHFRKGSSYRRQIKELKSVNRNQRFVFMNKVEELQNVNRYLKAELFNAKEDIFQMRDDLIEMRVLKEQYAQECRFYKNESKHFYKLSQLRFTPQEQNGVMTNYHTDFNPNKATCFICTEEKYSYTRVCCGMGICFDCILSNYKKKLERRVEGNQLVIGFDCPACGHRVSNSPDAIDPFLRENRDPEERWGGDDDYEGWQ